MSMCMNRMNAQWASRMLSLGVGVALSLALGPGPLVAQPEPDDRPSPVPLPFNPATDRPSLRPLSLEQSHHPMGTDRIGVSPADLDDDRIPMLSPDFPWSAMGRLDWVLDDGTAFPACTAALIGPQVILTNAHCLQFQSINLDTGDVEQDIFITPELYPTLISSLVFKPNLSDNTAPAAATVTRIVMGWIPESRPTAEDWALMVLDQPLGNAENYGHLGWRQLDLGDPAVLAALAETVQFIGYASDFPPAPLQAYGNPTHTAGVDPQCSILAQVQPGDNLAQLSAVDLSGALVHTCATPSGRSGGPLLAYFPDDGTYAIVGLHAQRITLLTSEVTLPNGDLLTVLNGGVRVDRWADRARTLLGEP